MKPSPTLTQALLILLALSAALPAAALDFPIVDTAQRQCYDDQHEISPPSEGQAFYGENAQHDGNQPNYTLSGDGLTVYDNVAGLTWMAMPDVTGEANCEIYDASERCVRALGPAQLENGATKLVLLR